MDGRASEDQAPLPAAELQRRAVSGSVWTVVHVAVSLPLAFVANAVIARSLGVSSYGQLAFLIAALSLAFAFANFGFSTAVIQQGSRAETGGRKKEADDLLQRSLGFHMLIELPILVVVAAVLTRGEPWWVLTAVGIGVFLSCLLSGAVLSITIENRTAAVAKLAMLGNLLLQAATVSVALVTTSASVIWATRTVAPALTAGLALLLLDAQRRKAVLNPLIPRGLSSMFWRYALFIWASEVVALLVFSRSEIFLLKALDQPEALGLFALAFGLSYHITAPVDAMLHPLLPAVAGVLSEWPDRAVRAFERSTRVSGLFAGAIAASAVPTLTFAIPLIYGQRFLAAAWLFVPLALVAAFKAANNPVTAFLNARQRGGVILRANAGALVVNLAVAIALIPPFGAWGAVAANAAGQLVALIMLLIAEPIGRTRGLGSLLYLYRPFLLGVLAGGFALGAGAILLSFSAVSAAIVSGFLGAGSFVALVRFFRSGLTAQDRVALLEAMSSGMRPHLSRLLWPITTPNAP